MEVTDKISPELMLMAMQETEEGITICDALRPGQPLHFVNRGFEIMTGYSASELIGKNLSLLHGKDTLQAEIAQMNKSQGRGERCDVTMRNYRKDGVMFWNHLSMKPVRNSAGIVTHFIGIHKNVSEKLMLEQQINELAYTDPLVGIANRRMFEERFSDLLHVAQRIHSGMSVLMIDIDLFSQFNDRYSQSAGDDCLRKVAKSIATLFSRASDCAARYGGEEFAVVSFSSSADSLRSQARKLCDQVRELAIPHLDSPHGIVTVSIGGVHRVPNRDSTEQSILAVAVQELQNAKRAGRNCVHVGS